MKHEDFNCNELYFNSWITTPFSSEDDDDQDDQIESKGRNAKEWKDKKTF